MTNYTYVSIWKKNKRASLLAQMVKNLPAMWEIWVWSLGWEHLLTNGMATHSSTHAWGMPWTDKAGGLQSLGSQRVEHDWVINFHFSSGKKKQKQKTKNKKKIQKKPKPFYIKNQILIVKLYIQKHTEYRHTSFYCT